MRPCEEARQTGCPGFWGINQAAAKQERKVAAGYGDAAGAELGIEEGQAESIVPSRDDEAEDTVPLKEDMYGAGQAQADCQGGA